MPIHRFVVAGRAAGLAIEQAVSAQAHRHLRLAEHAEFLAPATHFGLFALGADDPAHGWLRGHASSVERTREPGNVTEVTKSGSQVSGIRPQEIRSTNWTRCRNSVGELPVLKRRLFLTPET